MSTKFEPVFTDIKCLKYVGVLIFLLGWIFVSARNSSFFSFQFIYLFLSWLCSVSLTDKYRHKYPQQYYSYLIASHFKALVIFGTLLVLGQWAGGIEASAWRFLALVSGVAFFIMLPRKKISEDTIPIFKQMQLKGKPRSIEVPDLAIDWGKVLGSLKKVVPLRVSIAMEKIIRIFPADANGDRGEVTIFDLLSPEREKVHEDYGASFIYLQDPINQVKRLDLYIQYVAKKIEMGGVFGFQYVALEDVLDELKSNYKGWNRVLMYLRHFLIFRGLPKIIFLERLYFSKLFKWLDDIIYSKTKQNRRVISRAEMWGRMYYHGFQILGEECTGKEHLVLVQKVKNNKREKKPSFYMVTALNKVGLEGKLIRLHKIRSMYPFSEFIQERIYNDHGLNNTGKFKDDFRLTDFGKFIRKYWLDEIPQIYDWLRGNIKLVGMRATSPQYLSLYPQRVYDLYIQIKPGLIPPIFDADTDGFDDIVRIELDYLETYIKDPIRTDIKYFFMTFSDIFLRGVRSR